MIFELNEEQLMMQKMVREFAEKRIAPGAAERDEAEKFDRELYNGIVGLGVIRHLLPGRIRRRRRRYTELHSSG